jgi:hypothetical protein
MRHQKYKPGSIVLLRQLDSQGNVATIWGGKVLAAAATELTILAVEMVYEKEQWHCAGEFRSIKAPPHKQPYQWGFPRLLAQFEANDVDLKAKPVIETALALFEQKPTDKKSP